MKKLRYKLLLLVLSLFFLGFIGCNTVEKKEKNDWEELFNGKDLTGWKLLNGAAEYKVEDGAIVGNTVTESPNSFLCTDKIYNDFILEFEVWADPSVNSGVQFRSNSFDDFDNGRVHGYQFELESTNRAFSGGIYDEARRGWLYPLSLNENGRKAFKVGKWNACRIEAVGNSIKTWVNGIQCANLVDDLTSSGFIGLQVHSIDNDSLAGKNIKWKNIRIKTEDLDHERWPLDEKVTASSYLLNKLTDSEIKNGWRLLWDGKTSKGWRSSKQDQFPTEGWEIEDGVLTNSGILHKKEEGSGDIITENSFGEFELELEFKISEGGNSGIKYFVDTELNKGEGWEIGCEYQLLDDDNHPDAKEGVNGNRAIGSLYDLIGAENISVPGREKQFKGIGAWNKARIISKGNIVSHWLNDEKIVEYDRSSPRFEALVAQSKYKNWKDFGQIPSGHILLQDHGDTVYFRSIKIREFN